jgi:hypothetical protein
MRRSFGLIQSFVLQDQTTDGGQGGGGAGGAAGGGAAGGGAAGGAQGGGGATIPARPDYVPEQFWIKDKGQPNLEGFGKSYAEVLKERDTLKAGAPKPPEKYELKLVDGSLLKPEAIERTATTARALGLSQESAQKALDFANGEVKAYSDSLIAQHTTNVAKWKETVKADKEIFGANDTEFKKNVELAHRAARHFGGDDLMKELTATGYGDHPVLVRTFLKIAKAIGEDTFESGRQGGGAAEVTAAQRLYGPGTVIK